MPPPWGPPANDPGLVEQLTGWGIEFANAETVVNVKYPPVGTAAAKGDGVTDDTAAIVACQALLTGGGTLFFPAGTYIYSQLIAPLSNVTWLGTGPKASVLKRQSTANIQSCISGTALPTAPFTNFGTEKLGFDMNGYDIDFGAFITLSGIDGCWIEECVMFDSAPPTFTETVGTGDGATRTFFYTLGNATGVRKTLSRTVTLTDGTQTFVDDGHCNWVSESSPLQKDADIPIIQSIIASTHTNATLDAISPALTANAVFPITGQDIPAGTSLTVDPGGTSGVLSQAATGSHTSARTVGSEVNYGSYSIAATLQITFPTAPANGATISVTYSAVKQRQYILLTTSANVFIRDNILRHGGRIKVARPGARCVIANNNLRDVNDNAITVVTSSGHAPYNISTDLEITGNVILNPSGFGIVFGADGQIVNDATMIFRRINASGNIIVGDFQDGIQVVACAVSEQFRIDQNIIRRNSPLGNGSGTACGINLTQVTTPAVVEKGISIRGNIITGMMGLAGIQLGGITGAFNCEGNTIHDAPFARGIRLTGNLALGRICGNVIVNAQIPISHDVASTLTDVLISENVCSTTVAGNQCFRTTVNSIITRCRLKGNSFSGPGGAFNNTNNTSPDLDVVDNDFSGCAQALTLGTLAATALVARNKGYNPLGVTVVAVPATTVAVAADNFDRDFYVTAAAGGSTTMTIQNGPAVVIPASGVVCVRVPATKTVTPTYTSAPTWVVERL